MPPGTQSGAGVQEEAGATANIPQVVLPNGIANKNGDGDDDDDSDDGDTLSFFSDSLSTLFNVHSPARGSPGGHLTWTHPALLTPIAYKVPNHTGTSTSLFAHYQWDAGIELCKELCVGGSPNSAFDVSGKTVCELGAGTGLPSLVCARLGAVKVVVTDYPDEGILSTLKENVKSEKREDTVVEGLMWGDVAQEERVLSHTAGKGYDVLIICDTLWVSSSHTLLIHSLISLLSTTSPHARIFLSAGFHTGRPCVARFFAMCREADLVPECAWEKNVLTGETRAWMQDDQETDMGEIEERAKWCVLAVLRRGAVDG